MDRKNSWKQVRFDQICKNISNRIDDPKQANTDYYVGLEHLDSEEPRILRHGSPNDVNATKLKFKQGQILFGKRRWYQRKLAVAEREGICSAHMMVLEPIIGFITKDFLSVLMQSEDFFEKALRVSAGSLSPTIKWKDLAKEEFLIPSIPEQLSLTNLIIKLDDTIFNAQNLLEKTINYFISRRELLLTKGIGHKKFKKVKEFHDNKIEIPEEWEKIPLNQHTVIKDGDWILEENYSDEGVRLLQIGDIGIGQFIDKSKKYISEKTCEKLKCTIIQQGEDILISRMPAPIGRACVSPILPYPYIVAVDISILKYDVKKLDKIFLIHMLNSSKNLKNILKYVAGGTRPRISRKDLESIPIFLPPLSEQQEIACILSTIETQVLLQQTHIQTLKIMRKSILNSKLQMKEKKIVTN